MEFAEVDGVIVAGMSTGWFEPRDDDERLNCSDSVYCMDIVLPSGDCLIDNACFGGESR